MRCAVVATLIACAAQVQAVEYIVATVFDKDTTSTEPDTGAACTITETVQMVCLDPGATYGQTIFDTTDGIPPKTWTTTDVKEIYATTKATTPPATCAATATDCYVHPATAVTDTKLVTIADTTKLALTDGKAGNCLVNMFYGDYPFVVAGSVVPDRTSGNYTTGWVVAATPQECQTACVTADATTPGNCTLWTYLYKADMADSSIYTQGENCFLQSQKALDQLKVANEVNDCGFNHNMTYGFPTCADGTANAGEKVCALYTGYAVSGLIACDPAKTPTEAWMQKDTNSFCVIPTTTSSTAAVVTTVDPSAPTQTTTNTGSGVSSRVVMTSIAALAIGVSTLLL